MTTISTNNAVDTTANNVTVRDSMWTWSTTFIFDKEVIRKSYDTSIKKLTPGVKKVIYNNPATIVFWSDGTKTTSKCDDEDKFNEMTGFLLCVAKKYMGGERLKFSLEKNVYKKEK